MTSSETIDTSTTSHSETSYDSGTSTSLLLLAKLIGRPLGAPRDLDASPIASYNSHTTLGFLLRCWSELTQEEAIRTEVLNEAQESFHNRIDKLERE